MPLKGPKYQVFLSTGSNQGNSHVVLHQCNQLIALNLGDIRKLSAIYQTQAWGNTQQPDFLNQVIWIETIFPPKLLFRKIQHIEKLLGRVRREKWGPRIIDIDILFFDHRILKSEELVIPHPQIEHRNFVLKPLMDIAPNWKHPVSQKTIKELWQLGSDQLTVKSL